MIVTQQPYIDENGKEYENLVLHYSDSGYMIRQVETGIEYVNAIDSIPCRYTYEETDKIIETKEANDLIDETEEILPIPITIDAQYAEETEMAEKP